MYMPNNTSGDAHARPEEQQQWRFPAFVHTAPEVSYFDGSSQPHANVLGLAPNSSMQSPPNVLMGMYPHPMGMMPPVIGIPTMNAMNASLSHTLAASNSKSEGMMNESGGESLEEEDNRPLKKSSTERTGSSLPIRYATTEERRLARVASNKRMR
jgi:hypothetical protein